MRSFCCPLLPDSTYSDKLKEVTQIKLNLMLDYAALVALAEIIRRGSFEAAAAARGPHRIAFYLGDVAAAFHAWWNLGNDRPDARVILANDPELTATRLYLADGIGQVIRNGLHLMGVEALEEMN